MTLLFKKVEYNFASFLPKQMSVAPAARILFFPRHFNGGKGGLAQEAVLFFSSQLPFKFMGKQIQVAHGKRNKKGREDSGMSNSFLGSN